jgi:hypothetical protein
LHLLVPAESVSGVLSSPETGKREENRPGSNAMDEADALNADTFGDDAEVGEYPRCRHVLVLMVAVKLQLLLLL